MLKKIILFVGLLFFSCFAISQDVDTTLVVEDTVTVAKRNTFKEIFRGEPGRAALYGLILPGGGQIYNRRWIKTPIAWGIDGGAIAWMIYNRRLYKSYDRIFDDLVAGVIDNPYGFTQPREAKAPRDKYRKQTEYAWAFVAIAHLFTMFEGYVDRHLMDFDISEDLTIYPAPTPIITGHIAYGLEVRYQF